MNPVSVVCYRALLLVSLLCSCVAASAADDSLRESLAGYIARQDARIGVAVIVDGVDTVEVNGRRDFPMMSVVKFPQALAVADFCDRSGVSLYDMVDVDASEFKTGTWSPMRDALGSESRPIPLATLLYYSLTMSDNNACDILFRLIGGPAVADSVVRSMGCDGIVIQCTEDDMHRDVGLCYLNRSTPLAMAELFDRFYRGPLCDSTAVHRFIAGTMAECATGLDRLPAPLVNAGVTIGHKTGTGDVNSQGRIMAVNDAGYVFLSGGRGYSIAVFVADSAADMASTSRMIADISAIVFDAVNGSPAR